MMPSAKQDVRQLTTREHSHIGDCWLERMAVSAMTRRQQHLSSHPKWSKDESHRALFSYQRNIAIEAHGDIGRYINSRLRDILPIT